MFMNKMKLLVFGLLILLGFSGCVNHVFEVTERYAAIKDKVSLGDSKEKALPILLTVHEGLSSSQFRQADKYMENNDLIEVYYIRSGLVPDERVTDDEITPYMFKNGKLVSIGWAKLGGIKATTSY